MKLRPPGIRMKALATFRGKEGLVRRGTEFEAQGHGRADELERLCHAVRVTPKPLAVAVRDVEGGISFPDPFGQAGGAIGQEPPPLQSPPGQARKRSRSKKRADGSPSSASTNRGDSRHGQTSSTEQTDHGGSTEQGCLSFPDSN